MADSLAGRGGVQAVEVAEVVKSTPRAEGRAPLGPEAGGTGAEATGSSSCAFPPVSGAGARATMGLKRPSPRHRRRGGTGPCGARRASCSVHRGRGCNCLSASGPARMVWIPARAQARMPTAL